MTQNFSVLNKTAGRRVTQTISAIMAVFKISALTKFFNDDQKSIDRGENHYNSNHIESFTYIPGVLRGKVRASMKNKAYNVTVSQQLILVYR